MVLKKINDERWSKWSLLFCYRKQIPANTDEARLKEAEAVLLCADIPC